MVEAETWDDVLVTGVNSLGGFDVLAWGIFFSGLAHLGLHITARGEEPGHGKRPYDPLQPRGQTNTTFTHRPMWSPCLRASPQTPAVQGKRKGGATSDL